MINYHGTKGSILQEIGDEVYNRYKIRYMKKDGTFELMHKIYNEYCEEYLQNNFKGE